MIDEVSRLNLTKYSVSPEEAQILKNSRRRGVIRLLTDRKCKLSSLVDSVLGRKNDTGITKEEAVKKITEWENKLVEGIEDKHLERTNVSLIQQHLPKLEEAKVVNYRPQDSIIEPIYPEIDNYADMVEDEPCKHTPFHKVDPEIDLYLTANQGFDILSNERRQLSLQYIENSEDNPIEISDIAEFVASIENERIDSNGRKKHTPILYSTIYQECIAFK